jgi:uncharacterized protein YndB with AHSA1/START domain
MPVIDVTKDEAALTLTVTAEFAATPDRVWRLYADARLIERWWGPPGWPATFLTHELVPGGGSHYFMEGEDGTRHYGVWRVVEVEPGSSFAIEDAFADESGTPNEVMGWTRMATRIEPAVLDGGIDGTLSTMVSTFASAEQLSEMLAMGMDEGLRAAISQVDDLIAEGAI